MKLEDITTVEQAKALAFDQIQLIEQSQHNLRALQERIAQLDKLKAFEDANPPVGVEEAVETSDEDAVS